MTVAFTGHRPNKLSHDYEYTGALCRAIRASIRAELLKLGADTVISGMALGVDTIAAEVAIELHLKLIAAIPFKDQDRMWTSNSKRVYSHILSYERCESDIISEGGFSAHKMQIRNE